MSDRRGVIFIIFDLPVQTVNERRQYAKFRKSILRSGYVFFQKSVYVKLLRNISSADNEIQKIDDLAPDAGEIQTITMNLNVFRTLHAVRGVEFHLSDFADDVVIWGKDSNLDMMIEDEELVRLFGKPE